MLSSFDASFPEARSHLPYASIADLPPPVQSHLPLHAQEIYLAAFNNAWTEYQSRGVEQPEQTAHRVAWAAVKRKYRKSGERWISRRPTTPGIVSGFLQNEVDALFSSGIV
jgi:cation transport regulator